MYLQSTLPVFSLWLVANHSHPRIFETGRNLKPLLFAIQDLDLLSPGAGTCYRYFRILVPVTGTLLLGWRYARGTGTTRSMEARWVHVGFSGFLLVSCFKSTVSVHVSPRIRELHTPRRQSDASSESTC
jgi:hypothetical protein